MTSALRRLSIRSLRSAAKQNILPYRGETEAQVGTITLVIFNRLHAQGCGGGRTELGSLRQAPSQAAPGHPSVCKATAWPKRPELPGVVHSTSRHTCLPAP